MNEKFNEEFEVIKNINIENRKKIFSKYPDYFISGGLDGEPWSREIKEESIRFQKEVNKLKEKYGIK